MKNVICVLAVAALIFGISNVANAGDCKCCQAEKCGVVKNVVATAESVVVRVVSAPVRLAKAIRAHRCGCTCATATCGCCTPAMGTGTAAAIRTPATCTPVTPAPAACAAPACAPVTCGCEHKLFHRHRRCGQ